MRWLLVLTLVGAAAVAAIAAFGAESPVAPEAAPPPERTNEPANHHAAAMARREVPAPAPSLQERIAAARGVRDVVALLRARGPIPGDDGRALVAFLESDASSSLAFYERSLLARRQSSGEDDEARIAELKLRISCLEEERRLGALRRGDYFFYRDRCPEPGGEYEFVGHGVSGIDYDLATVHRRSGGEPLRQLRRELEFHVKIREFNGLSETMRRRVLRLRQESLATGDPDEQEWIRNYFPDGCVIDEIAATIR